MTPGLPSRHSRALRFSIAAAAFGAALRLACPASAEAPAPIKLALFDFELEDASAAASITGESAADIAQLRLVTAEARRLIEQSGRYVLVDTSGADADAVKKRSLRNCNGCDAGAALKLGAEQSLIGIVTRISRTEYTVRFQIRDARSGGVVLDRYTDLRMGADYSWPRGAAWLIKNRLLESQDRP